MSYETIGRAAVVLFAAGWCFILLALATAFIDSRIEKWRDRIRWEGARDVGNRVLAASWWFGEDVRTQTVLRELGLDLCEFGHFDNDKLRERWRVLTTEEKANG